MKKFLFTLFFSVSVSVTANTQDTGQTDINAAKTEIQKVESTPSTDTIPAKLQDQLNQKVANIQKQRKQPQVIESSSQNYILKYFIGMTFFMAIMFGFLFLLRKFNAHLKKKSGIDSQLDCIGRLQIDAKSSVVMVRTDHDDLVIGCNQNHISLLAKYPRKDSNEDENSFDTNLQDCLNNKQENCDEI